MGILLAYPIGPEYPGCDSESNPHIEEDTAACINVSCEKVCVLYKDQIDQIMCFEPLTIAHTYKTKCLRIKISMFVCLYWESYLISTQ